MEPEHEGFGTSSLVVDAKLALAGARYEALLRRLLWQGPGLWSLDEAARLTSVNASGFKIFDARNASGIICSGAQPNKTPESHHSHASGAGRDLGGAIGT